MVCAGLSVPLRAVQPRPSLTGYPQELILLERI